MGLCPRPHQASHKPSPFCSGVRGGKEETTKYPLTMLFTSSFLLECPHILTGKIVNEEQIKVLNEAFKFKPKIAVLPAKE